MTPMTKEALAELRRVAVVLRGKNADAPEVTPSPELIAYLNATGPDVILELLDALEGEQGRTKELESQRALAFTACNRWRDKFAEAEEKLEAKDARITELEEDAQAFIGFKDVMQKATEALSSGEPLNLESLFKGELASAMFAMMFAGEFVRSGATNYLELLYSVPEFGELTVTLQKVEGKTPGQRIEELQSRAESAEQARTVTLPEAKFCPSEYQGSVLWNETEIWNKALEACAEAIRAAGITLQIQGGE